MSTNHEEELLKVITVEKQSPCSCGNTYISHMVSQVGEYTGWGWFWVLFGVTTEPVRVKFVCRKCKAVVGESSDRRILRRDV
ncbi:hypothetical protein EBU99_04545 [bacterium]|nr:hypothetical protein [bacterium]